MLAYKEITPLTSDDIFIIINSENDGFNYPIHYHSDYELTLVLNSSGNRLIGDSVEKYDTKDLVLIGPKIFHKWDDDDMPPDKKGNAHVITIQFSHKLFEQPFFKNSSFFSITKLLNDSQRGLKFMNATIDSIAKKMMDLVSVKGFNSFILFFEILQSLSLATNTISLTSEGFASVIEDKKGSKVNEMYKYIINHYQRHNFRISELADEFNMSSSAFGHAFKKYTNKSFTQFIVDLRLSHASKLLLNSSLSISEIAYKSGFNNISNFNKLFLKNKFCSPKQYKMKLSQTNDFNWKKQLNPNQFLPFEIA